MMIKDAEYYEGLEKAYAKMCDALRPLAVKVNLPAGANLIEAIPIAIALINNGNRIISHQAFMLTREQAQEYGFLPQLPKGSPLDPT